ncbi:hypothetical protein MMC12_006628 [Toensbergia leucococca]|nr:hypothetical protein [Toensbergia leucococca]
MELHQQDHLDAPQVKKPRLEATPTTPIDDPDDLYSTPPAIPCSPTEKVTIFESHASSYPLSRLPGLGQFNHDGHSAFEEPLGDTTIGIPKTAVTDTPFSAALEQNKDPISQPEQLLGALASVAEITCDKLPSSQSFTSLQDPRPASGNFSLGTSLTLGPASVVDAINHEVDTKSSTSLRNGTSDLHMPECTYQTSCQPAGHCLAGHLSSTSPNMGISNGLQINSSPALDVLEGPRPGGERASYISSALPKVDDLPISSPLQFHQGNNVATKGAPVQPDPLLAYAAEAKDINTDAEFELDSSPIESSSSGTSSDSSSSDENDDDGYKLLDPEEQAHRLMQEDGGSDDEGLKNGGNVAGSGQLRTLNEKPEEIVPKPNVTITADMKIEELGDVENLVENIVLIKAKTSGEYQVLETGSVLCLGDRTVIGVVAETLGRVQQPLYCVRFTNASTIFEAGILKGTQIFYVERHSTYVFTQPLKAFKGSDASNLHDEEVGDDELDFSDDEAEAEHKRKVKSHRQPKRGVRGNTNNGISRDTRQDIRGERSGYHDAPMSYENGAGINYDDNDEDLYTPLARPSNLHEMMGQSEAPLEVRSNRDLAERVGRGNRNRGRSDRGRGRGERVRGRGDRRDRGGGGDGGRNPKDWRNGSQPRLPEPSEQSGSLTQINGLGSPRRTIPQSAMGPPQLPLISNSSSAPRQSFPHPSWPTQHDQSQRWNLPQNQYQLPQDHRPQILFRQPPAQPDHQDQQHHSQQPHYTIHQSPRSTQSANIPPGAFINPAFFPGQYQQLPTQQHSHSQQHWQSQVQPPSNQSGYGPRPGWMSPESGSTFRAAQDRLTVLRHLSQGFGPSS